MPSSDYMGKGFKMTVDIATWMESITLLFNFQGEIVRRVGHDPASRFVGGEGTAELSFEAIQPKDDGSAHFEFTAQAEADIKGPWGLDHRIRPMVSCYGKFPPTPPPPPHPPPPPPPPSPPCPPPPRPPPPPPWFLVPYPPPPPPSPPSPPETCWLGASYTAKHLGTNRIRVQVAPTPRSRAAHHPPPHAAGCSPSRSPYLATWVGTHPRHPPPAPTPSAPTPSAPTPSAPTPSAPTYQVTLIKWKEAAGVTVDFGPVGPNPNPSPHPAPTLTPTLTPTTNPNP